MNDESVLKTDRDSSRSATPHHTHGVGQHRSGSAEDGRGRAPDQLAGPLVYLPGVTWDAVAGSDRQLAVALTKHGEVIWVDPPVSVLRTCDLDLRATHPVRGLTRLRTLSPPGVSRPVVRSLARWLQLARLQQYLRRAGPSPFAVLVSSGEPLLAALDKSPGIKVYFATDDFVEAAQLWGMSAARLARSREENLAAADLVLAVTPALASQLRRGSQEPIVFPNGTDLERYRGVDEVPVATDVRRSDILAGVVGQFNERTDLTWLRAVADSGVPLLLVGPESFAAQRSREEFIGLTHHARVQWIGQVPAQALPGYLRAMSVGLTAYADTVFNRRSNPLKTVEYLAAGLPVVTSAAVSVAGLDPRFVQVAGTREEFVSAVHEMSRTAFARAEIQAAVASFGWDVRAETLVRLLLGY